MEHFISHRGNLNGRIKEYENDPAYIRDALNAGFEVEIDVWCCNNCFYLGHDFDFWHLIERDFLETEGLWCHAKNYEALKMLRAFSIKHYFAHNKDARVLTSSNYIWTYPGEELGPYCISVMPELAHENKIEKIIETHSNIGLAGICSDRIFELKKGFKND